MWCAMSEDDDARLNKTNKKTTCTFPCQVSRFMCFCVGLGCHVVIGVGRLVVRFHLAYAIPSFLLDGVVRLFNSDCNHNYCLLHIAETGHLRCCLYNFCSECQDVWLRVPARDRVGTLRQLKARGWWKELPPRGRSGAPLIPRISMERVVLDLFPPVPDGAEPLAHRETLSADPCVSWCECVTLSRHLVK